MKELIKIQAGNSELVPNHKMEIGSSKRPIKQIQLWQA